MQHAMTELFSLESNFNAGTYTLTHLPTGKSLFFQGDDALQFDLEYEQLTQGEAYSEALQELWFQYNIIPLPFEL